MDRCCHHSQGLISPAENGLSHLSCTFLTHLTRGFLTLKYMISYLCDKNSVSVRSIPSSPSCSHTCCSFLLKQKWSATGPSCNTSFPVLPQYCLSVAPNPSHLLLMCYPKPSSPCPVFYLSFIDTTLERVALHLPDSSSPDQPCLAPMVAFAGLCLPFAEQCLGSPPFLPESGTHPCCWAEQITKVCPYSERWSKG